MLRVRFPRLALLLAAGLLAACSEASTPTPTPGGTVPGAETEVFAWVLSAADGTITYDPAEILTGEAAHDAAVEAGVITEAEDLPNDFFIANPDEEAVTASLDPDGTYILLGLGSDQAIDEVTLSMEEFVAALETGAGFYGVIPGETPMQLVLTGDQVLSATQEYLP